MNKKKVTAILLAATMVIGSTFTAFAAETPSNASPSNASGSTTGTGTNEGHVDKEVINVVLPTIPEGSTPFAYTTDPERLIQATAGANAKYEDFTLPDEDTDTGVYFLVGDKQLANESETLQVINKSSVDVSVTVDIDTTTGANDLVLAGNATPSDAAPLSLNLKVGATNTPVTGGSQQVTKTIAGNESNFEVTYNDGYGYTEKAGASDWKALNISMNGSVEKVEAKAETTAPTIKVTWSYAKAAAGTPVDDADQVDYASATAPSIAVKSYAMVSGESVYVTLDYGTGALAATGIAKITYTNSQGVSTVLDAANYSIEGEGNTTLRFRAGYLTGVTSTRDYTIIFDDDAATEVTITLTR